MLNFNYWYNNDPEKLYKKHHCCNASGGISSARMEAVLRKIKMLAEKIKRLKDQMMMAKSPAEKNSLQIRIEQAQAEIAILERELNT